LKSLYEVEMCQQTATQVRLDRRP